MRCPKCGYNSFDYLDSCKKCGKDLVEFKQRFGIRSVLFPGRVAPQVEVPEEAAEEFAEVPATAKVAATVGAAAAATAAGAAVREAVKVASTSEADDFGFDFMGDSNEDEDLSFDELFEEMPAEEDVEETLPAPEAEAADKAAQADDEFVFDSGGADEDDELPENDALEDDFGFDVDEEAADKKDPEAADVAADGFVIDDIETPQAEEQGLDFDSDNIEFADDGEVGGQGDPKDPFDQPEAALHEELPEHAARREDENYFFEDTLNDDPPGEQLTAEEPAAAVLEPEDVFHDQFAVQHAAFEELPEDPDVVDVVSAPDEALEPEAVAAPLAAAAAAAVALDPLEDATESQDLPLEQPLSFPPLPRRVIAFVCDLLLLLMVGVSFVVAAEAAMTDGSAGLFPNLETLVDLSIPYFLVLFALAFGYFTLFHFLAGQTPGKMLAGLRVETLEGEPLIFSQAFLRSVGGLLQLLPLGLGYLVIVFSSDQRGWNDRLAGTRLIDLKAAVELA